MVAPPKPGPLRRYGRSAGRQAQASDRQARINRVARWVGPVGNRRRAGVVVHGHGAQQRPRATAS